MEKDAKWLAWAEQRFAQVAGEDRLIYLDEFKKALNVKKSFFAERFFELIDTDNSGNISLSELMDALRVLVHGSAADKLHFLFRVYDVDGNGTIDYEELRTVLRSCTAESALQLCDETLDELTQVLFEEADSDCSGNICFEELRAQLEKYPDIAENLTISASEWLRPPSLQRKQLGNNVNCCNFSTKNIRNNVDMIIFMTLYIAANIACIVSGAFMGHRQYPDSPWVMVARSSGRCLSFNCVFILILMLKKCLTVLRSTKLSTYLPMDQHVDLHKFVGYAIVFFSVIHTCGHTANYVQWSQNNETNYTLVDYLFTTKPGIGWVFGTANVTGWALLFVLAVIVLCSTPCIRRKGYFQVFYWTHQLAFIFWILLLFHSGTFWMWALLPGAIYIVERILRLKLVQRARHGRTYIKKSVLLPANVTHLVVPRPANFHFHAGEYVYINIPAIARHEWHPFTISSAPEQREFITIHIRAIGNWTKRLYDFFREKELQAENLRVDPSYDAYQATNPIFKGQILESLAEEGSMSHSEDANASSVVTKSTYVDLETEVNKESMRKESQTSAALSDFSVPGSITETEPTDNITSETTKNASADNVDDSTKKILLEKDTKDNPTKDIEHSINGGGSKLRVPRGTRRRTKPLSTSPKKTTSVPLLPQSSHDAVVMKPRANSADGDNSRTPTMQSAGSQSLTKASILQHESKRAKSKTLSRRESSQSSIKSARTIAPMGRKVLGRISTQHSLNISNIDEFGNEDTGVELYIDGPYGAPSQHIFEAEHAVLIGAGIGVTPFASILQSIHMRYKAARNTCPSCGHAWMDGDIPSLLQLKKVDFFWINRDQRSFEWFISLLNQIEVEQEEIAPSERFITMRLYMTSALGKNDMKAIGLHMALDLIHQKRQRDMITGLMTKTEAGRPDWNQVFKQLEEERKGRVTVFFCGSPHLGNVIRQKCFQHGFDFRKENF
ncbi:NADPH oxidase 5-like [Amphiura filiformis]|uniref:NADPH oxidase 5-like n=1 Tax=Amphiura filiformis TaxID=82378 RepID=UPI003B219ACD